MKETHFPFYQKRRQWTKAPILLPQNWWQCSWEKAKETTCQKQEARAAFLQKVAIGGVVVAIGLVAIALEVMRRYGIFPFRP
ncbi:MAG TPA: hypothetical protein VG759_10790 [Candidatus Angelobacter sp.]|nr:hypothetical protein [Candidatus Angelobacter sp.]